MKMTATLKTSKKSSGFCFTIKILINFPLFDLYHVIVLVFEFCKYFFHVPFVPFPGFERNTWLTELTWVSATVTCMIKDIKPPTKLLKMQLPIPQYMTLYYKQCTKNT